MKYYLGLSGGYDRGHDASAALIAVNDGNVEIIGAVEEERFSRNRYSANELPHHSINWCLQQISNSTTLNDIDSMAFSWDWPKIYDSHKKYFDGYDILTDKLISKDHINKVQFLDHHKCHAASAYYPSGFRDAAVIVLDGQGENESGSIWKAKNGKLTLVSTFDIGTSLGYFYQAASSYIGFGGAHAGKTMGLSSYGNPKFYDKLRETFIVKDLSLKLNDFSISKKDFMSSSLDEEEKVIFYWLKKFSHMCKKGPNYRRNDYDFTQFPNPYLDLAASVQKVATDAILDIVRNVKKVLPYDSLCLAGGSFLNCMANGEIANLGLFKKIFIQPAANDAGAALGAAFLAAGENNYTLKNTFTPLLGPELTNKEIVNELKNQGIQYHEKECYANDIAELIMQGKSVGLFQGKMEFGPRALGNRSIIASPTVSGNKDYINSKIKSREHGRSFGPSVIVDDKNYIFGEAIVNEHMTITQKVLNTTLTEILHVDGTTRPNIVTQDINPLYYSQLSKIKEKTGFGVVINTSLNCNGPIGVCQESCRIKLYIF